MTLRPSDRAWCVLAAGVIAYEACAPRDELLSEACDRYLISHPTATRFVIAVVAAHLGNAIPPQADALHWLFLAARWTRKRFSKEA